MKISIIVPIFKVEKEIESCLISIFKQDYCNLEIILVDDCSPDKSLEVAQNLVNDYGFSAKVQYVRHKENKGVSSARNSGITIAKGKYIFFLDSDDELASNDVISYLSFLISLNEIEPDLLMGNFYRISNNIIIESKELPYKTYNNNKIFHAYSKGSFWHTACGKLISTSFLRKNKIFFEKGIYHEDELWFFNLMCKARKVITTPKVVYSYKKRVGSITSNTNEKHVQDMNFVVSRMYDHFKDKKTSPKETALIIERFRRSTLKKLFALKSSPNTFKTSELKKLKAINLSPLVTFKGQYFRQNLLLRLPNKFVIWYLSLKWGKR